MLMDKYCMSDRNCPSCPFESECIMRKILYSKFDVPPYFIKDGGSCGYVIECEDYRTEFLPGDELHFQILLFGKTIAYFPQILEAFINLGKQGLGEGKALYTVVSVTNSLRQDLYRDGSIFREKFEVSTVGNYVEYRLRKKAGLRAVFHTPAEFLIQKSLITDFDPLIIFRSIVRRIYILNFFEGNYIDTMSIGSDRKKNYVDPPIASGQKSWVVSNKRFSTSQKAGYSMKGIKGHIDFVDLTEEQYSLLLAGELIHIGKDTSFGYGKYTMVDAGADSLRT